MGSQRMNTGRSGRVDWEKYLRERGWMGMDWQPVFCDYSDVFDDQNGARFSMHSALQRDGLCFIKNSPESKCPSDEETRTPEFVWALLRQAFVLPQFQTEKVNANVIPDKLEQEAVWNPRRMERCVNESRLPYCSVIANAAPALNPESTHGTYSNESLPMHTDGAYLKEPPRLKFLATYDFSVRKGVNIPRADRPLEPPLSRFVDGYAVLAQLSKNDLELLFNHAVTHVIVDDPSEAPLLCRMPLLSIHKDEFLSFRWNAHDRERKRMEREMPQLSMDSLRASNPDLAKVLRKIEKIVETDSGSNSLMYRARCADGVIAVVDNWRVLHGRDAISPWMSRKNLLADLGNQAVQKLWENHG
ncbi:MAG: hypothetical protein GY768_11670 [Planctomycetaceae bacterium]|nr:hypothetical protein [Planctomycetaceae bacterium]